MRDERGVGSLWRAASQPASQSQATAIYNHDRWTHAPCTLSMEDMTTLTNLSNSPGSFLASSATSPAVADTVAAACRGG